MINKLLEEMIQEMWNIKDSKSFIDTEKLIEFSEQYFNAFNLVIDLINSNVIKDKEHNNLNKNKKNIIAFFKRISKNKYNRLIVDTLIEIDDEESIKYLKEIISTNNNYISFKNDFMYHPDYERILSRIS